MDQIQFERMPFAFFSILCVNDALFKALVIIAVDTSSRKIHMLAAASSLVPEGTMKGSARHVSDALSSAQLTPSSITLIHH